MPAGGKRMRKKGRVAGALGRFFDGFKRFWRSRATEALAWEYREYENLFALMLLSPAAGIPGPPSLLSLELLPDIERELVVLLDRARESSDPYGELFSIFEVG